jgi:hypothetical protein
MNKIMMIMMMLMMNRGYLRLPSGAKVTLFFLMYQVGDANPFGAYSFSLLKGLCSSSNPV